VLAAEADIAALQLGEKLLGKALVCI